MFIDAAHVRAYQHAAGIKDQDIARSIGGNSSKIHLAVDANGNSIELILSDGVTHDAKVAPDLINKIEYKNTEVLYADKGYCQRHSKIDPFYLTNGKVKLTPLISY